MSIQEFFQSPNMEIILNIILFLAGLVLGNWLAIGRDKRKEFNQIADKVYLALKKQKEGIKENSAVVSGPKSGDLEKLRRRVSFLKKNSLTESIQKYREVTASDNWEQDGYGQAFYKDSKIVIRSIEDLLHYTKRK